MSQIVEPASGKRIFRVARKNALCACGCRHPSSWIMPCQWPVRYLGTDDHLRNEQIRFLFARGELVGLVEPVTYRIFSLAFDFMDQSLFAAATQPRSCLMISQ